MATLFNSLYKVQQYGIIQIQYSVVSFRFLERMIKIRMRICGEKLPSSERSVHATSACQRLRV
jgi:hypothetical protein